MLIREILTESKVDEAPVGIVKRGLAALGAKLGSQKLKGYGDTAKMANALYKDIEQWQGRSGLGAITPDDLMASPLFQGDQIMPKILANMHTGDGPINKATLQKATLAYAQEFNRTGGTVATALGQDGGDDGEVSPQAAAQLAKDVEVIDRDPLILRYRNVDYFLGDRGQWVNSKTNKNAPEPFQAFLNKQADIIDGVDTATPAAPATAAPKPAAPRAKPAPAAPAPRPAAPRAKGKGAKI